MAFIPLIWCVLLFRQREEVGNRSSLLQKSGIHSSFHPLHPFRDSDKEKRSGIQINGMNAIKAFPGARIQKREEKNGTRSVPTTLKQVGNRWARIQKREEKNGTRSVPTTLKQVGNRRSRIQKRYLTTECRLLTANTYFRINILRVAAYLSAVRV